jgi:hypothetical protein
MTKKRIGSSKVSIHSFSIVTKSIIKPTDFYLHPLTFEGHVKGVKCHKVWLSTSVPKASQVLGMKGCQSQ